MSFWSIVYYPSIVNKYQAFRSNIFSKTLKCKYKGDIFLCELSWNSHFLSNRNSPTEKGGKTSNRDWHVGRCSSFLSMWVILSLSLCNTHSFFLIHSLPELYNFKVICVKFIQVDLCKIHKKTAWFSYKK